MSLYKNVNLSFILRTFHKIKKYGQTVIEDIRDALRDLVLFVQFKKREKRPWRSVNFGKVAGLKQACFSRFLNCTNGTK